MGVTSLLVVLGAGVLGYRVSQHVSGGKSSADEALEWNDRYSILATQAAGSHSYVLAHVWTTVPDFMQRVDLYCYEGIRTTVDRADLRMSRRLASESLEDDWRRLENGGYTARSPTRGAINVGKKFVTVEFDKGRPQLIVMPFLEDRGRCPATSLGTPPVK